MREIKMQVDDKYMNLTDNGVDYKNKDGVITMPDNVAEKFIKANVPGLKVYNKTFGFRISEERWNKIFSK